MAYISLRHVGKRYQMGEITITAVDDGGGRVRLGGEEWSARLAPGAQGTGRGEAGARVTVTQIDGAVAVVAPATTPADTSGP